MKRQVARAWPLRLWLVLALFVIVSAPALTTWALTAATAPGPPPGEMATLVAVRRLLGIDAARWRDTTWQRWARKQLAALKVDVLLDDVSGHQVFATSGAQALLAWWNGRAGHVSIGESVLPTPATGRTPPPSRLLTMLPLYTAAPYTGPRGVQASWLSLWAELRSGYPRSRPLPDRRPGSCRWPACWPCSGLSRWSPGASTAWCCARWRP